MYQPMLVFSERKKPLRHITKPLRHITTLCFSISRQYRWEMYGCRHHWQPLHRLGDHLGLRPYTILGGHHWQLPQPLVDNFEEQPLWQPWLAPLAATTTTERPPWTTTSWTTLGKHCWQQLQQPGDDLGPRLLEQPLEGTPGNSYSNWATTLDYDF